MMQNKLEQTVIQFQKKNPNLQIRCQKKDLIYKTPLINLRFLFPSKFKHTSQLFLTNCIVMSCRYISETRYPPLIRRFYQTFVNIFSDSYMYRGCVTEEATSPLQKERQVNIFSINFIYVYMINLNKIAFKAKFYNTEILY